jgi:hypothetical protein
LTPVKVTLNGVIHVRYRGAGECASEVRGIRVRVDGFIKNLDGTGVFVATYTIRDCGGPDFPPTFVRCPVVFGEYFQTATPRRPACHWYWTHVVIDVAFNGIPGWTLQADHENSQNIKLGPAC